MRLRGLPCFVTCLMALGCSSSDAAPDSATDGAGTFQLLFRDDFAALDQNRWQLMTHSWGSNLALFSSVPVAIEDGALVIRLLPAPEGTVDSGGVAKSFLGAEVRSKDTVEYGRVRARIKFAS